MSGKHRLFSHNSSDSDTTLPAIDDFESRFYEIDDELEIDGGDSIAPIIARVTPRQRYQNPKAPLTKKHIVAGTPCRLRETELLAVSSGASSEEFPVKKTVARSRTRTGYLSSQSSLWTLEDISATTERGDQGQTSGQSSALTPEQLEVRRRRIERRRESAKTKAEKEMQETVEKLLRVNTDYGSNTNGRGGGGSSRNAIFAALSSSSQESSENDGVSDGHQQKKKDKKKKRRNALHPSMSLDPPTGYVRLIYSQRIPQNPKASLLIALPHADSKLPLSSTREPTTPRPQRMCEQCLVAPRRYACRQSGRSLCSLECFTAAMAAGPTPAASSCC